MAYTVKEIFYTLQGEGAQTGCAAVFLRFTGCNLWSGQERHRSQAVCQFCDTDFTGTDGPNGGRFATPEALAAAVAACWPTTVRAHRLVVCTGGEPLLQLDPPLIAALQSHGFRVAVETNGTVAAPPGLDWICVSPKADAPLVQQSGHELKLVFPQSQAEAAPARFEAMRFEHFFLQPMDGPEQGRNIEHAIAYCLAHPQWRLSLQTHKITGIP